MNTAYNDEDGFLTNLAYFLYVELAGAVKNQIQMDKKRSILLIKISKVHKFVKNEA